MRPSLPISFVSSTISRSTSRKHAIGFIGLGAMGKEMARNLLTKTFQEDKEASFVVCDADPTAVTRFLTSDASLHPTREIFASASPASLAKSCSTIITMLPSSPQVKEVYLGGEEGLLAGLLQGRDGDETLCIDCTTCDRQTGVDVAREIREKVKGGEMIDAPVSGGVTGAAAGTLTFLCGSETPSLFSQAEKTLSRMGSRVIHCGSSGAGLTAKICNNLALGINMLATAEAMAMGVYGGLSPQAMAHVLNTSTGRSWSSEVNNPAPGALRNSSSSSGAGVGPPADRDYQGGFATRLMAKDLRLALQAAQQVGLPTPLAVLASRIYDNLEQRQDYTNKDFSVVFKALVESAEILKAQKDQQGDAQPSQQGEAKL